MLPIRVISDCQIVLHGGGYLLPWLGPALRGIADRAFKRHSCLQPVETQTSQWQRCTSGKNICPELETCVYGYHLEHFDDPRLMIIAPYFDATNPLPEESFPGLAIPIQMTAIGLPGTQALSQFAACLQDEAENETGIGEDQIQFEFPWLDRHEEITHLDASDFPCQASDAKGIVAKLGIGLKAPLFLRSIKSSPTQKKAPPNLCPEFIDLFRVSEGLITGLFKRFGTPIEEPRDELFELAQEVRMVDHCYEPFVQSRSSSRKQQADGQARGRSARAFEMKGVIGGGVYANVPQCLLPWVLWAGRLHVGGHRSAGAGNWRIILD